MTGATSGLGRAAAESIATLGGHVCIVGRDPERTERARSEISAAAGSAVEADLADLSSLAETAAFAARFAEGHDRLDVLVLNAGALTHQYTVDGEGNELTLATHVLSPFLLTRALRPLLEASAPSRVIVVASGGMYTEPLDVDALDPEPAALRRDEDIRALQAGAGRAGRGVDASSCSAPASPSTPCIPGWADTPGLRTALPGFSRIVGPLLRTPEEGADTIVWLAAAPDAAELSGLFFLDRRARAKHRLAGTRRPDEAREAARLWRLCMERTAPFAADSAAQPPDSAVVSVLRRLPKPVDRVIPVVEEANGLHLSQDRRTLPAGTVTSARLRRLPLRDLRSGGGRRGGR